MTLSSELHQLSQADLADWPGSYIRAPRRSDGTWLVYEPLSRQMKQRLAEHFAGRTDLAVLDVGCADKPWLPVVAPYAASYRGLDVTPGPYVDDVGRGEAMPYADDSFDLVICTQVLEHVGDPAAVVSECARVVRPGGLVLASTHGVFFYHPALNEGVDDLWRWTHAGLRELFATNGRWSAVAVSPNGDMIACAGLLLCLLVAGPASRFPVRGVGVALLTVINAAAAWVDRRVPRHARVPQQGSLSANYLVAATKRRD